MQFRTKPIALKVFLYIIIILRYPLTQLCDQQDRWLYLLQADNRIDDELLLHCANLLTADVTYTNYGHHNDVSVFESILFNLQFVLNREQFISFGHHRQYGEVVVKYFNQFQNYQWLRFCTNKSRPIPKSDEFHGDSMQVDLLKFLANNNFKVPKIHEVCGLIVIQSYNGETLSNFYGYPLRDRLQMSVNLLKMVLEFTEGINGFRFYPTDINPDNIAINKTTFEPTLIDLDNTIVIDSSVLSSQAIAKHRIIDCNNCIAFMPEEFCLHPTNDFNLFQMCQILMYDMNGKRENGFLYDLESNANENLNEINYLLYQCYECHDNSDCDNRLASVIKLINSITVFIAATSENL